MSWTYGQLMLLSLAAMFSPGTLTFSMLALVLGNRPLRTGAWFYLGGLSAMLVIGTAAALVLGNAAASRTSTPKTWVAIFDIVAALLLGLFVVRWLRRPASSAWMQGAVERMGGIASSPAVAVLGAGALLAIPGAFIPLALKAISETNPSDLEYILEWAGFTLVALLPLAIALLLLLVAREWTLARLHKARGWLDRHLRTIVAVLCLLLVISLLRAGIGGLTS